MNLNQDDLSNRLKSINGMAALALEGTNAKVLKIINHKIKEPKTKP